MRGAIPFGGLNVALGAGTQALTTAAGLFAGWGAAFSDDTYNESGDPAVRPDLANNRVLVNCPGVYKVTFVLEGTCATGSDVLVGIRKNGVVYSQLQGGARISTNRGQVIVDGYMQVNPSDTAKIGTFADPASTEFIGAGGAPKTLTTLDVVLSVATSTDTLTIINASLTVERRG